MVEKQDYVCLKNISSNAVLAVMGAEDQLFAEHYGFDLESIEKQWNTISANQKRCAVLQPSASKVAKMYFYGKVDPGLEKDWKFILR